MEIRLDGALTALARWPLSRARLVGSLPGSARNMNILVEDAGGSRYVLRCCRDRLERKALPHFVVATQARTSARYRVREREGADPAQALRAHVARMRALSASLA